MTFGAPTSYGTDNSLGVVIADVNGDGIPDIVAPESGSGSSVDVYLGTGNGTFGAATNFSCASSTLGASQPYAVAVADLTGNGHMDIVTANFGGTMSVLMGNGDGTFGAATVYAAGSEPNGIAVGDFNGDGLMDIAVANRGSNDVGLYLNTGGGNFAAAVDLPTGAGPDSVGAADLNKDGRLDLFTANTAASNTVSVLLNFVASGNFCGCRQLQRARWAERRGCRRLQRGWKSRYRNRQHKRRLGQRSSGCRGWHLSTSAVTQKRPSVRIPQSPLYDGSFNGDGHADVAVIGLSSNTAAVLLGNGDGPASSR